MPASETHQAPPAFGRYQDPVMLGSGGMGAVYRATDPALDRFVAIKVLTRREPRYVERFRREAQVLAKIVHPSIIQIYEIVGSDEGQSDPYIVMEYFEGKPLDSALKTGPLSGNQVISILRRASEGLKKAHANDVIHHDIKPANIMLAPNGDVKILDFGIAKLRDAKKDLTGQNVHGTPHYMSPEQAMGQPIDARTDIYSLGITAFQLLTGKRPFEAKSKVDVMLLQVKNPLPSIHDLVECDKRVVQLVERMCSKQPPARFQNCDELIAALDMLPSSLGGRQADTASALPPVPKLTPSPSPAGAAKAIDAEAPRPAPRTPPRASIAAAPTPASIQTPPAPWLQGRLHTPSAQPALRPPMRLGPPRAVPRAASRMWLGVVAGGGAALIALAALAFFMTRGPTRGVSRVPQKGWMSPGAPAPPLKRVQASGGYGNCVFAARDLERGKEEPGAVRTIFSADEPILGRCYFAHQIGANKAGEVWQELWVDGAKRAQIIYDPALPDDEDQLAMEISKRHASRLSELSAGKHTLEVWIYRQGKESDNPEPLAAGALVVRK
jgi:serine/threonine-protein kinase